MMALEWRIFAGQYVTSLVPGLLCYTSFEEHVAPDQGQASRFVDGCQVLEHALRDSAQSAPAESQRCQGRIVQVRCRTSTRVEPGTAFIQNLAPPRLRKNSERFPHTSKP